ncbi:putative m7GpppX diphosphatase [Blattamonas nauphoetae]|uniref:M7GpppX diphosphatase n=1 Tax=Blattamonas nauphoetae TaxID=2049346 RepID=A0ABQ9YFR6_9EUKA|nr:putative m7GpppX diphosphatase [Blattamonas nauphoetae]
MTIPFKLSEFHFERIVNILTDSNTVIVLATRVSGTQNEPGLLFFKKAAFDPEVVPRFFEVSTDDERSSRDCAEFTELQLHNSKFYNFIGECDPSLNPLFIKMIYPCTDADIKKTPLLYSGASLPFIESRSTESELKWVRNIVDGQAEQESIIYSSNQPDEGFVVLPDQKWDKQNTDSLYCLGIVKTNALRTIRDLTQAHIPLLLAMKEEGIKQISTKFNIDPSRVLCYLHYLPSFMQLHVHYVSTERSDMHAPRCHLVDDVIDNLRRSPTYYSDCSLTIVVQNDHQIIKTVQSSVKELLQ